MKKLSFSETLPEVHTKYLPTILKGVKCILSLRVREAFKSYSTQSNISFKEKTYVVVSPDSMKNEIIHSQFLADSQDEAVSFLKRNLSDSIIREIEKSSSIEELQKIKETIISEIKFT